MSESFNLNRHIQLIRQANLTLRRDLERVELQVPELNDAIRQLARLGFGDKFYLGDVIHDSSYGIGSATPDDALIVQICLSRTKGVGAIIWDIESRAAFYRSPLTNLDSLAHKFIVFEEMPAAFRAMLAPRIKPLVERLCNELLPRD